jgi:hypothetical protein
LSEVGHAVQAVLAGQEPAVVFHRAVELAAERSRVGVE